jgi:diaminopimelate epimerase
MQFWKAHAYGNDFLYVARRDAQGAQLEALAREMCDRHTGIGADGLILFDSLDDNDSPHRREAGMTLLNADGSRAEVSGNGVRALAALLLRDDEAAEAVLTVQTDGGSKRLVRVGREGSRQVFRASMGAPTGLCEEELQVGGESIRVVTLNMGNPQCVILGALPDERRFREVGSALEHHVRFAEGTNVEFACVEQPDRVRILIWERGVGPTSSSGTGSCASLVAAAAFGGASREADVVAPGGAQRVEWRDDSVYLTGWAEVVCEGRWLRQIPRG